MTETAQWPLAGGSPKTLTRPAAATQCEWVIHVGGPAPTAYADVVFYNLKAERGATATRYSDEGVPRALTASLSVVQAVAVDAASRLASARFEVIAAAGNDPAQLLIRADTSGSLARMVASSIGFANVVGGQVIEAMRLIGGEVFFMRPIYIDVGDKRLIVGPGGTWVLWFGGNDKPASQATRTNGIFALGTDGQVYLGSTQINDTATRKDMRSIIKLIGRGQGVSAFDLDPVTPGSAGGKWFVSLNGGSRSNQDGSTAPTAIGALTLFRVINGQEQQAGGEVSLSTDNAELTPIDFSDLNMKIANASGAATTWRVKIAGGPGNTNFSTGYFRGNLTVEWVP